MSVLAEKYLKILTAFVSLKKSWSLIWASGKNWVAAQILLSIIRGILPAALVYLTKQFVDNLVLTINLPGDFSKIIVIGALLGGMMLLSELLNNLSQTAYAAHAEKLQDYIFALIHEKSVKADLAFYEQAEFYDQLHRAGNEARYRPVELTGQLGSLLQSCITLGAMSLLLLQYGVWLPLVLIVSTLPAIYVILNSSLRLYDWQRRKTAQERRANYYNQVLTGSENAAELRLFGLGDYFRQKYGELRVTLRKQRLQLAIKQRIAELFATLAALILTLLVFVWMIWRVLKGFGTLGDLVLFYQIFNLGQNLIRDFLQNIGRIYANSLFMNDLFEFLALEAKVVSPENPVAFPQKLEVGITFENVTFGYQTSKRFALKNFDLFIPAGKIVAIVGSNGAGKSTLLKLLCRFYDVEKGKIKFDGINIKEFSLEDLRRKITVLFQTPVHYSVTARQNIAFGNVAGENDEGEISSAAEDAGADEIIERLPKKYEQILGNWFKEGTELSVGEWQRVALARAFLRAAPLILLDEPTSAMDSWAETEWLKRFLRKSQNHTVVIITHRFTTAKQADLIYVMEKGEIVESGSHEELLLQNGLYAESWHEQMKTIDKND